MTPYRLPFIPVLSALHPDMKFCVSIKTSTVCVLQPSLLADWGWCSRCCVVSLLSAPDSFSSIHKRGSSQNEQNLCFPTSSHLPPLCILYTLWIRSASRLWFLLTIPQAWCSYQVFPILLSLNLFLWITPIWLSSGAKLRLCLALPAAANTSSCLKPFPRVYLCLPRAWVKDMSLHCTRHLHFHMSPTKPTFSVLYVFLRSLCDVSLTVHAPNWSSQLSISPVLPSVHLQIPCLTFQTC